MLMWVLFSGLVGDAAGVDVGAAVGTVVGAGVGVGFGPRWVKASLVASETTWESV